MILNDLTLIKLKIREIISSSVKAIKGVKLLQVAIFRLQNRLRLLQLAADHVEYLLELGLVEGHVR